MSTTNTKPDSETKGDWRNTELSWATMCSQFVLENPDDGDVTFLVGHQKEEIKSFKFCLRVASPVFDRAFSTDWDHSNPIPLPDVEPQSFRHFLKLIFKDGIDGSQIKSLNLQLGEILSILYISAKYDVARISKAVLSFLDKEITIQNALYIYENVANFDGDTTLLRFVTENFNHIIKQDSFMETPVEVLAQLLKSNDLRVNELELFKALCRWGKFQLNKNNEEKEDEISGENLRSSLGDLLPLIRFPLFTPRDLVNQVPKGLLSLEEAYSTITYIVQNNDEKRKEMLAQNNFPFVVEHRKPVYKEKVLFPSDSNATLFTCVKNNKIDVDIVSKKHSLRIHGFGFHGPIQDDCKYDVSFEICNWGDNVKETKIKTILAKKNELFHFCFDPPVLIKQNRLDTRCRISIGLEGIENFPNHWYGVRFCISGTNLNDVYHKSRTINCGNQLNSPLEIKIEPPVVLDKDKVYYFQFDVKEDWTQSDATTMTYNSGLKLIHVKFETIS